MREATQSKTPPMGRGCTLPPLNPNPMRVFLDLFRQAGESSWYVYEVQPEVQVDDDGRKFVEFPEEKDAIWVEMSSPLGLAIAEVLSAS